MSRLFLVTIVVLKAADQPVAMPMPSCIRWLP